MKKYLTILLSALLLLSLCGCRDLIEPDRPAEKPVIYLYPEEVTDVTVQLDYSGKLTCTYPAYENGWTVTPAPDSILRVFMAWQPLEAPVDIPAQTLPAFERHGFALVEWGGAEIDGITLSSRAQPRDLKGNLP